MSKCLGIYCPSKAQRHPHVYWWGAWGTRDRGKGGHEKGPGTEQETPLRRRALFLKEICMSKERQVFDTRRPWGWRRRGRDFVLIINWFINYCFYNVLAKRRRTCLGKHLSVFQVWLQLVCLRIPEKAMQGTEGGFGNLLRDKHQLDRHSGNQWEQILHWAQVSNSNCFSLDQNHVGKGLCKRNIKSQYLLSCLQPPLTAWTSIM